jgi:light-regulated signal transduction histidine kinase (bacteriophytochrome)
MGLLIDGLLAFSRLSRQPIARQRIDMAALARDCLAELRPGNAEVALGALPEAQADPLLLHQVMLNLLGNALKYSSRAAQPRVQVGAEDRDGTTAWFVRDNGVGFDMKHAAKLFGVFHRLHAAEEFEGTGVGLAIVQRIVQRHGGRVWAEAAPGEGATFWFTLGAP